MNQFRKVIRNWEDWEATAGEISAFSGVVEKIFHNEGLPAADIRELPPSTNAVFRVGDYVIKIYAPRQAQMEPEEEQRIERFAMWRAGEAGVPVPEIAAWGCLKDQYDFYYLISRYMEGQPFGEVVRRMETAEKRRMGARLRDLTDRMNTPCAPFRKVDVLTDPDRQVRWQGYQENFRGDRKNYLEGRCFGEQVFVHGDLNGGNVLVDKEGGIWFLDFAEAVPAPALYEQMYVAVELFQMDAALLEGYFPGYSREALAELITEGLLMHDFGGDLVRRYFGGPDGLYTVKDLAGRVRGRLEAGGYSGEIYGRS